VGQPGVNAHGESLESSRVPDCYLGLVVNPAEDAEAAGVLVAAPADDRPPRPGRPRAGVRGGPDGRAARLVHRHLGQARHRPAGGRWRGDRRLAPRRPHGPAPWRADGRGGPSVGAAGHDDAREQLRQRLAKQVGQAYLRWLHPGSGCRPRDRFL
jgi:hypothetical protein